MNSGPKSSELTVLPTRPNCKLANFIKNLENWCIDDVIRVQWNYIFYLEADSTNWVRTTSMLLFLFRLALLVRQQTTR